MQRGSWMQSAILNNRCVCFIVSCSWHSDYITREVNIAWGNDDKYANHITTSGRWWIRKSNYHIWNKLKKWSITVPSRGRLCFQITGESNVISTDCSAHQSSNHQSSATLTFWDGNPSATGGFPSQRASDVGNISIPLRNRRKCQCGVKVVAACFDYLRGENKPQNLVVCACSAIYYLDNKISVSL